MNNSFFDFNVYNLPDLTNIQELLSGKNERRILIGIFDEQQDSLTLFLNKIITAAKVDLENDCVILRGTHSLPTFSQVKSLHKIEKAVLFGIKGKDLGLNIETPLYIPFQFNNCQFLFADKLSAIENAQDKKKSLWIGLQTMFL